MILDLIVHFDLDGFTSEIPSLKGVESWAKTEDESIENVIEQLQFYFNISDKKEIKIDLARKESKKNIYKIVLKNETFNY